MSFLFFALGILECAFFCMLYAQGRRSAAEAGKDFLASRQVPPHGWPRVAMIVPMAGSDSRMQAAVTSLINQNYENFGVILVTAGDNEPAADLAARLASIYPDVRHVTAGVARACGQKNHNILAGVAAAGDAGVYAFCDSTHMARPDFLRCLVGPLARGECAFSTGYHQVITARRDLPALAYALCVMFMGCLQAVPGLCQPWGGAMAIGARAFELYDIAALWAHNVVDDCSLGAFLRSRGMRARFCPAAMLVTEPGRLTFSSWHSWLERQILFLKFCIPGQWSGLGLACLWLAIPPAFALLAILGGLLGVAGAVAPFLALIWLVALGGALGPWRKVLPGRISMTRWLLAFALAIYGFALSFAGSLAERCIVWHGITYLVGPGGTVRGMHVKN